MIATIQKQLKMVVFSNQSFFFLTRFLNFSLLCAVDRSFPICNYRCNHDLCLVLLIVLYPHKLLYSMLLIQLFRYYYLRCIIILFILQYIIPIFLRIFKFYIILMLYVGMSEEQIYVYDSRETDSNRMELYQQMEVIVCIANYVLSKSGIICQT